MKNYTTERTLEKMEKAKSQQDGNEENDRMTSRFSPAALRRASQYIKILALSHGETEEETRKVIVNTIKEAMNNPDPEVRRTWATFKYSGDEPTPEEFLLWFYELYSVAVNTRSTKL